MKTLNKKNTLLGILLGQLAIGSSASAATLITSAGSDGSVDIDGSGITYSITGGGTHLDESGFSFFNAPTGNPLCIEFTGAVDIVITNTSANNSFVFDTQGEISTTGGVLNYTVGTADAEAADGDFAVFSGNGTNNFTWTATQTTATNKTDSNADWGVITADGVTILCLANTSFKDSYSITASAVPEPSSVALLGLASLSLGLRRRRQTSC